jgi:hypothetical protein
MTTLITHFYNESKLLPFWLQHHLEMFDHGILIDHHSTDDSVEICRKWAPHWTVVTSKLKKFDAIDTDFEVMSYEATVSGWKMVLNVTEFLHFPDFKKRLLEAQNRGVMTIRTRGLVMVDCEEGKEIDPSVPLIKQKHHGFIEKESRKRLFNSSVLVFQNGKQTVRAFRERIIHRYLTGAYYPGRHKTFYKINEKPEDVFTLWYGYSPWVDWNIERKLAFSARIPEEDKKQGLGVQHLRSKEQLENDYLLNKELSYDLQPILEGHGLPPSKLSTFFKLRWVMFLSFLKQKALLLFKK